jgi:hypothetical protein
VDANQGKPSAPEELGKDLTVLINLSESLVKKLPSTCFKLIKMKMIGVLAVRDMAQFSMTEAAIGNKFSP